MSDNEFERRLATALRAPVVTRDDARERIMRRVRHAALAGAPHGRSRPPRPMRHSIVGLAMAASIGSVAMLSVVAPQRGTTGSADVGAIGDSVTAALRDTIRLMRLIHASDLRYAFVVDGLRWAPDPAIAPVRADDRLAPLLRVARDSN